MEEKVILVNGRDEAVGVGEKIETHLSGELHRAFSVFVFNSAGELLLQKRAVTKYHSGSLWSNTCCGHPRPGEETAAAARRRLREEMGFECELREVFQFIYRVQLGRDLYEHEYDHVFVGEFDGEPLPNSEEAEDWKWIGVAELRRDMRRNPGAYTFWSKIALDKLAASGAL